MLALLALSGVAWAQQQPKPAERAYPKEIRGYKIERAKVEIRAQKNETEAKTASGAKATNAAEDADALIQFGEPRVARVTPLGLTLEVPITIAPVKQGGHVDFLAFEEMVVNGTPVTVDEYDHPFELPNKNSLTLSEPIRLFISAPRVLLGAIDEWGNSKEVWPVTGRVYVFGRFKKFLFKFKRAVPIELSLSLSNPLRVEKQRIEPASEQ
ncbi:MAG: hypothetical protein QOF02_1809 [Blastocatellia bacterium]|jgi:hypothetical protein|nr:hypothetical protein [Blastocatellia bacterium]